jgi:hypothetical protein
MRNNKRKTITNCFKCDVEIIGPKGYCQPCHTKILEKIKWRGGKKPLKSNNPT